MIAAVREWLISVVCAAMLVSVAENAAPPGNLRKIVSLIGGLILLVVLVRPLTALDLRDWIPEYSGYVREVEQRQDELEKDQTRQLQILIEQRTAAYISDKAEALGLTCRVEVECRTDGDSLPRPFGVTVFGTASQELRNWIRQELDIPEERQVYHETEP